MKQIRCFIPNVLLSFLLVFFLLAAQMTVFVKAYVLNTNTFRTIAVEQQLADKAYASLESYFQTRSNSTGIPAEVFTDVMTPEELHEGILGSMEQAFAYLNGKTHSYEFTMDFTALEASVNTFFSDYAEENGYQKDAVYEQKVASVIEEAKAEIIFVTDTFKFTTMYNQGWLQTARTYFAYLTPAMAACLAAVGVILLLLVVCNLKQPLHLLYWTGISGFTAALLLLIPCSILTAKDYFSGFAIKDPQIFAAVVGYLESIISAVTMLEIVTLVIAVIFLILFGFLQAQMKKKDA